MKCLCAGVETGKFSINQPTYFTAGILVLPGETYSPRQTAYRHMLGHTIIGRGHEPKANTNSKAKPCPPSFQNKQEVSVIKTFNTF